jgi:hypothetical protein
MTKPLRSGSFTRQHFQFIADNIRELPEPERTRAAKVFANNLTATNPRFNRERFLKATGASGEATLRDV